MQNLLIWLPLDQNLLDSTALETIMTRNNHEGEKEEGEREEAGRTGQSQ
jgi:hypothetical protein